MQRPIDMWSQNLQRQRVQVRTTARSTEFRLVPFRSPLLRESKRSNRADERFVGCDYYAVCFSIFLRLLRCFSSPGLRLIRLCIQRTDVPPSAGQVSPFGNPRVKGCLPPYRGLSQAATSFIVFLCQGIHHILLRDFPTLLIIISKVYFFCSLL